MNMDEMIVEGRRLLDEADHAPWHLVMRPVTTIVDDDGMGICQPFSHNAELIVWARNNLPALLDALDDAECESERLRGDWIIENRQRKAVEAALARAQQAYAAVARIRHLHQQYLPVAVDYDCCSHCNVGGSYVEWPCPTIRALDGDQ